MKKLRILLALSGLAALALSCGQKASKGIPAPEAAQYIKAHTGGIVTPQATLRIELVSEIPADRQVSDGLFSFRPDLKGTVIWNAHAARRSNGAGSTVKRTAACRSSLASISTS